MDENVKKEREIIDAVLENPNELKAEINAADKPRLEEISKTLESFAPMNDSNPLWQRQDINRVFDHPNYMVENIAFDARADMIADVAQSRLSVLDEQETKTVENPLKPSLDEQTPSKDNNEALEVNSIEANLDQLQNIDDEVRLNTARLWAKREADKAVEASEQSAKNIDIPDGGSNEIDNDDIFGDRSQKTQYRAILPKEIEQSYLRVGNKFHYNAKPELQAFEDKGNKLETTSNSEHVAADLVKIANARGWGDIKVRGTDEFKRQVWLEASIKGIGVTGYKPTDADRALLEKKQKEAPANTIEQANPRATNGRAAPDNKQTEKQANLPAENAAASQTKEAETKSKNQNLAGVLLDHGHAKYNFDKDEKNNYFVKFKDDNGVEKTVWGVDLARAVADSNAKIGQRVELENKGREAVVVPVAIKDKDGKVIDHTKIEVHRNAWEVKADALRTQEPKEAVKNHPDLVNAYSVIKAAEILAKNKFETTQDQHKFVSMTKESLAKHIEITQSVPKVTLKDTEQAKEQTRETEQEIGR